MRDGGKGDLRRPLTVSEEKFNASWDLIFGKKDGVSIVQTIPTEETLEEKLNHEKECGK